jgi:receptor protein-tyrosine kinase
MNAIPHVVESAQSEREPAIGEILVESGRLKAEHTGKILAEQKARGLPFGSTAVSLGLVTQGDVDLALARQFGYPCLSPESRALDRSLVAAFDPFGATAEHLRVLRSQLTLRWLKTQSARKTLAVTGVGRGEGRSFVAANLAVLFAQGGARTLLIDADLRHPALHSLFRVSARSGLSSLLAGRVPIEAVIPVPELGELFLLPAGPIPPNPQELLGKPMFAERLRRLEKFFDLVIVDTTAATGGADGQIVAAAAGAALLVVRQHATALTPLGAICAAIGAVVVLWLWRGR